MRRVGDERYNAQCESSFEVVGSQNETKIRIA
jgi:hypothetical protein